VAPGAVGQFFAKLLNRPSMPCDPRMTLIAVDSQTGAIVDFEGLIGFQLNPAMASGAPGVLHLLGQKADNSDFVITDESSLLSYLLFARVDFSKSDVFQPACVVNSASLIHAWTGSSSLAFPQNRLEPGEIISIYGKGLGPAAAFQSPPGLPLPYRVENTQVVLAGISLPLLYVSDTEIRAVVPYSFPETAWVTMTIQNGDFQFADSFLAGNGSIYGPGGFSGAIFTRDDSNLAAALNQDGTGNSVDNPAARGSIVSLFATGLGPFNLPISDNDWTPTQPPWPSIIAPISAEIMSVSMPILYAGPAPGQPPGVYQLNVQIPDSAATGSTKVSIAWKVPNGTLFDVSQSGVWIAVK
jgi:uncharacterized protein (TIGR03437 family)